MMNEWEEEIILRYRLLYIKYYSNISFAILISEGS